MASIAKFWVSTSRRPCAFSFFLFQRHGEKKGETRKHFGVNCLLPATAAAEGG
jgi:hypothetical protein